MTDLSNNGSGANTDTSTDTNSNTGEATAAAEPTTPAPSSTAKKAPMADESKTTTSTSGGASGSTVDESRLRATLQQIEARAEELRRWGMARQEMAREVVEERPLVVVGAAFSVGLLLGLIASRV